jgi:hypothetical protein
MSTAKTNMPQKRQPLWQFRHQLLGTMWLHLYPGLEGLQATRLAKISI